MNATTIREAYNELNEQLGKRESRKLSHNTYIRRAGSDLTIKFHNTDILTYHDNGSATLAAEGWHTVTTARRFSDYLPRLWSVGNERGVWNVWGPTNERRIIGRGEWAYSAPVVAAHFRFWDGMTITDDPRPLLLNYRAAPDFPAADNLARDLGALIDGYVAGYTAETIRGLFPTGVDSVSVAGDCLYCHASAGTTFLSVSERGTAPYDPTSAPEHLISHTLEHYYMVSLVLNAYRFKGYGSAELVLFMDTGARLDATRVRKHIRDYLRGMILPHGIPAVDSAQLDYLREETAA